MSQGKEGGGGKEGGRKDGRTGGKQHTSQRERNLLYLCPRLLDVVADHLESHLVRKKEGGREGGREGGLTLISNEMERRREGGREGVLLTSSTWPGIQGPLRRTFFCKSSRI